MNITSGCGGSKRFVLAESCQKIRYGTIHERASDNHNLCLFASAIELSGLLNLVEPACLAKENQQTRVFGVDLFM
jgi:hypothetical protein